MSKYKYESEWPDVPLKQSRYVKVIEERANSENYKMLYDRLSTNILILDEAGTNIYNSFVHPSKIGRLFQEERSEESKTLLKDLLQQNFLVPVYDDEHWKIDKIKSNIREIPEISTSYLIVTRQCNLRCKYCFLGNSKENTTTMTIETARMAIDKIMDAITHSSVKEQKIILYGGEPFIAKKTAFFIGDYVKQKEKDLKASGKMKEDVGVYFFIISNGTLIDEEIAKFCRTHDMYISISIDGPEEIHNKTRIYKGGQGTYKEVIRGLKLLQKEGISVTASTTITNENIEHLDEVTEHIRSLGFDRISFNILMGENFETEEMKELAKKTAERIVNLYAKYRETDFLVYPVIKQVRPLARGNFHLADCSACTGGQVTISPEGKIGICQAFINNQEQFEYSLKETDSIVSLMETAPMFNEWKNRSPINMDDCQNCDAIAICGGGCAFNPFYSKGTIWEPDEMFCPYAKTVLDRMLEDIFHKTVESDKATFLSK